MPAPDTVGYVTVADSGGGFHLAGIPPGNYVVYAIADQNGNRRRDRPGEAPGPLGDSLRHPLRIAGRRIIDHQNMDARR